MFSILTVDVFVVPLFSSNEPNLTGLKYNVPAAGNVVIARGLPEQRELDEVFRPAARIEGEYPAAATFSAA